MLEQLKEQVYEANMELQKQNLVIFTWGNASGIDRKSRLVVIKPSGVPYDELKPDDMVVLDLDGNIVEGKYNPSSDTKTHIVLYKSFKDIGGVVHTHSTHATAISQAGVSIRPLGTTHADYFYGEIPITRDLSSHEINGDYEKETGNVIVETFDYLKINYSDMNAVLVKNHGPFTWGKNPMDAVHNAVVLEEISKMYIYSCSLNPNATNMSKNLLDKHYLRKHGKNAYYGQKSL